MNPGASWTVPAAQAGTRRTLYLFKGGPVTVGGEKVSDLAAIEIHADVTVELTNGDLVSEFLLLQGRPIGEPVVQHGPFVMNTQAEIVQTFADYQRTRFGGWPWPDAAPVHGRETARFARHPDGHNESPAERAASAEVK
jgi:redox-sensitive bicupin YhaK (pirin superfamily)